MLLKALRLQSGAAGRGQSLHDPSVLDFRRDGLTLYPSQPWAAPTLRAIRVPKVARTTTVIEACVDFGDAISNTPTANRLLEYFRASITTADTSLWVNLSPYESSRLLPAELMHTVLGRDLLKIDYRLKRLSASLLYPESTSGAEFWNVVTSRVQAACGTVPSLRAFLKVWLTPTRADIYSPAEMPEVAVIKPSPLREWMTAALASTDVVGVIVNQDFDVRCEADSYALEQHFKSEMIALTSTDRIANDCAAGTFRDLVLPVIRKELSTGKAFASFRSIMSSIILANFWKTQIGHSKGMESVVNSGDSRLLQTSIGGANTTSEMLVPLDRHYYYRRYLDLFESGLFRYTRPSEGALDDRATTIFISGAIDLRDINAVIASIACRKNND